MERDLMEWLVKWKDSADRKPLLLTGVRQCGKTYLLRQFGERYFEDTAYFYFEGDRRLASIFEYDFDTDRILGELEALVLGRPIVSGKTLVIFDEIQACPRAVTALKYFCEAKRELHIVCAGSLLGVSVKREGLSFPVGKVDRLHMYPMTFSEFLQADGKGGLISGAHRYAPGTEVPEAYTMPLKNELKLYYIVGGMPEAVLSWTRNRDFEAVDRVLGNLLEDYSGDFAKYAPRTDVPKLGWIWDSVPKQLARENNKFIFSHVKQGKRSSELEGALEWLSDAGLVYRLELVEKPQLPLSFSANASYFKVYMDDVGLLRRKCGLQAATVLGEDALYSSFKGALTENYVLTQLVAGGKKPYFWRSGNTAELDFIFEDGGRVIPMEAKAEIHTRAKSYRLFCQTYGPEVGFRCSMKNAGVNQAGQTKTYSLPLYMLWRLDEYMKQGV